MTRRPARSPWPLAPPWPNADRRRSFLYQSRWGAYDAYVLRLTRQLSVGELDLFAFPQNTWGGENMLIYLLSAVLGLAVHNPCEPHVESVGHLAAAVPPLAEPASTVPAPGARPCAWCTSTVSCPLV